MKMRLRPCKRADGEMIATWIADEKGLRLWSRDRFSYPLTKGQMDDYYREIETNDNIFGFTALDEAGRPIGSFRMLVADWKAEAVHMGFIIVDPNLRGNGCGRQMVGLALDYAARILGMKRVTLKVFNCNQTARRCYEKAGFSEEEYKADDFSCLGESWGNSLMVWEPGPTACS